ncbi:hypothetical protein EGYY_21250 [Eggerthella sp. YY7918]|nr:hypothetical protein EGYY_21250 [Eggerthella sp. YY7918]
MTQHESKGSKDASTMIDCTELEFTYDGDRLALAGVDLSVKSGEFICILGGNGSGKSTLAKHLNALLLPDKGTVMVDGYNTAEARDVYRIRSTAGMVFQNPDDQLVASLVEDDVAFGPENLGVETAELAQRVRDALKEVGLVGFEKHETHALSGGQKQRVAIAGVLSMQPKILILDEASAMLDPRGRRGLMRVCKELNARGMTIVMITHFMEEAAEADRVVVLDRGAVACLGTPQEVLVRTDVLADLNLEVPFAADLAYKLQQRGVDVPLCVEEEQLANVLVNTLEGGTSSTHVPAATEKPETAEAAPDSPTESADDNDVVIEFQDVSFTYTPAKSKRKRDQKKKGAAKQAEWGNDPDAIWAIHNVSFSVKRGEFFGIAGHTGSGKSTLIQHMNGILRPTQGRVLVEGLDIADKKQATRVRTDVGVVFQYPEHQLFADTVYNDVAFGPRNLKLAEDEVDARVRESLALVQLDFDELRDVSPFELSGGQQRRVAFAGVLAMRPSILVLDEPVAGLDPAARLDFLELITRLHDQGLTVIMISHSMDDLAKRCDRMLVLNEGEVFEVGAPRTVFLHAEELNAIGLGIPSAQRLSNRLREQGLPLSANTLFTTDSLADELASLAGVAR